MSMKGSIPEFVVSLFESGLLDGLGLNEAEGLGVSCAAKSGANIHCDFSFRPEDSADNDAIIYFIHKFSIPNMIGMWFNYMKKYNYWLGLKKDVVADIKSAIHEAKPSKLFFYYEQGNTSSSTKMRDHPLNSHLNWSSFQTDIKWDKGQSHKLVTIQCGTISMEKMQKLVDDPEFQNKHSLAL